MNEVKSCFPSCRKFRCGKNSLAIYGNRAWCRWADEPCNVKNCSYAICTVRRLLPGGVCGETIKRKTVERKIEDTGPIVKVRGKAFRKIGEKEIF